MNIIPFHVEHIGAMDLQTQQRTIISHMCIEYLKHLEAVGPALSAEHEGRIIASAGIAFQGFGMGMLWAFVSQQAGPHFIRLDRCVRRFLDIPKLRRIEASTEATFSQGCRWLELLGFQNEGILRKYGPNGEDHIRYARV